MTPEQARAIAWSVHEVRSSWPIRDISRAIADDPRPFDVVLLAGITAARNPETKFPGGIRTTFAQWSSGCDRCNTKDATSQPPPLERCSKCGRISSDFHECNPMKPTKSWHEHRRTITRRFLPLIGDAIADGRYDDADDLRNRWKQELAESRDSYRVEIGSPEWVIE